MDEKYLQNPFLETKNFIKFCRKRGISVYATELSFFEKEKLLFPVDTDAQKKYYSNFQIYWLEILKESFSIKLDFAEELKKVSGKNVFSAIFDFDKKKQELKQEYEKFDQILKFLLHIQDGYYPYACSGSRTIQIKGDSYGKWLEVKREIDLEEALNTSKLNIDDVGKWYKILADKAKTILGINGHDWVQLWKNCSWRKKDNLGGNVRRGVEYLQWAIMLKRVLEDYLQREVLDLDEMNSLSYNGVLKIDPVKMDHGMLSRIVRNRRYSDSEKNYYHDKYKRLFYLANDFQLDYQPRVIVFVEGKTEEKIFPKVFEWYYGKPENFGIEFVNFEGVDRFLSTSENANKLRRLLIDLQRQLKKKILSKNKHTELNQIINGLKDIDIVISNWTAFLSYNLEKWQIIPFFVSDNEGNIKHFLEAEKPIRFNGGNYNVPQGWKFLWGVDNDNKPFVGNNFELANFRNQEIALVLTELFGKEIKKDQIQKLRADGNGINQLDINIDGKKIEIAKNLIDNLLNQHAKSKDESLLDRPIFKVIQKIVELASSNYPPTNREIELRNKEFIGKELARGKWK